MYKRVPNKSPTIGLDLNSPIIFVKLSNIIHESDKQQIIQPALQPLDILAYNFMFPLIPQALGLFGKQIWREGEGRWIEVREKRVKYSLLNRSYDRRISV